jgi:hypothetical protein
MEGSPIGTDDSQPTILPLERSREMRRALRAAMAAPDVRADRVLVVKQRIAQGTFRVMPAIVAWAMVNARV